MEKNSSSQPRKDLTMTTKLPDRLAAGEMISVQVPVQISAVKVDGDPDGDGSDAGWMLYVNDTALDALHIPPDGLGRALKLVENYGIGADLLVAAPDDWVC